MVVLISSGDGLRLGGEKRRTGDASEYHFVHCPGSSMCCIRQSTPTFQLGTEYASDCDITVCPLWWHTTVQDENDSDG